MLGRKHLCSFNPVYQTNGNCGGTRTTEDFDFWGDKRTKNYESYDDFGGSEIEFQAHQTEMEDDYGAYSPPLWTTRNIRCEASPLLPYNHHYSYPSPRSRLQAIADGRRELMEMIKDMPESSYELSLKDIVDEQQQIIEGVQQDVVKVERNLNFETEIKIKQKKKRNTRRGQISRSESMDSGVFLLKMFFPTSICSKKKSSPGKRSKVSPSPSFDGSEKPVEKQWWKIRFLVTGKSKNSASSRISGSTSSSSSSSSSRSRDADSNFTPGCWSFPINKCKSRTHRGCLF